MRLKSDDKVRPKQKHKMVKRRSVNIVALVGALLIAWWLWPSADEPVALPETSKDDRFVSDIQPIARADAADRVLPGGPDVATKKQAPGSGVASQELLKRFANVNQLIDVGQSNSAVVELKALIRDFPAATELYINLAALYSKNDQLELARQTLTQGIQVNQNTSVLFDSLQKVHGAQAARAYQLALNTTDAGDQESAVLLPLVATLDLGTGLSNSATGNETVDNIKSDLARLNNKVSALQLERDQLVQSNQLLEKDKAELLKLNGGLELEKSSLEEENNNYAKDKSNLELSAKSLERGKNSLVLENRKLTQANQALGLEKAALSEELLALNGTSSALTTSEQQRQTLSADLEKQKQLSAQHLKSLEAKTEQVSKLAAQVARSEQAINKLNAEYKASIASLQAQLSSRQSSSTQVASTEQQTLVNKPIEAAAQEQEVALAQKQTVAQQEVQQSTQAELSPSREDVASGLVVAWAASWSAQNVSDYVAHYADNYTPPRASLTRQQWLEQRRVRLTNKTFINVQVSDFVIKDLDDQFSVTFSQHYRSNTVDDTITKTLVFAKNSGEWSNAKIVNEIVVSR